MILNFRLLAGLINLESILWELHFSESGPEGTLEFKLMGEKVVCFYLQASQPKPKRRMARGMEMKPR
jgi:hypothetical protein